MKKSQRDAYEMELSLIVPTFEENGTFMLVVRFLFSQFSVGDPNDNL